MNKPVAWMQDYQNCKCPDNEARCFSDLVFRMMQKHTHPVKELTQQEIDKIENSVYLKTIAKGKPIGSYGQELVKAILRKAQEK